MGNYNFNEDIILGETGEDVIIEDLKSLGGKLISKNKDNRYDFIINRRGKKIKYEVKTDVYVKPKFDSGNIFVEYESRGKKSGISVTQADWFVTYFQNLNEIWYIKTDNLKELIKNNNFRQTVGGDAGSFTKGYLIKRNDYKKHFIIRETKKGV